MKEISPYSIGYIQGKLLFGSNTYNSVSFTFKTSVFKISNSVLR